jgi:malate dehydrogenase (oxaloacetate-decarboxylating)
VIGEVGGLLGAIDLVRVERGTKVRDVTVLAEDAAHIERIAAEVEAVDGVEVERVSDRTFLLHLGGKLEVRAKTPIKTRDDLSMAYTPGVARICEAIAQDPENVWNLTVKRNAVAIVTDRDSGPRARRHRSRGGTAGDGGQGDPLQAVRRYRRLAALPEHQGS